MNKEVSMVTGGMCLSALGMFTLQMNDYLGFDEHLLYSTILTGGLITAWEYKSFIKTKLDKLFINCGLVINTSYGQLLIPKVIKKVRKDDGMDYILSLPPGLSLSEFRQKEEHISQTLDAKITFEYNNGIIIMSERKAKLKTTYPFTPIHTDTPLGIVLGYSVKGPVILPLDSAPSPHLGVFGETNGGKSVILRGLLAQLITDKSPEEIELHLIDPKRVEFNMFRNSKFVKSFSREISEIVKVLSEIVNETDRRYKLLEKMDTTTNIRQYNQKAAEKLKYILVVVDEFADLSDSSDCMNMIEYIARKARAVGIHLILSTQRPDKDILNGKIKANIGNILGLKTTTQVNSRIIIDTEGLENLRGFGHGIFKSAGGEYTEIQSMLIEPEQAKKLIKHTFEQKFAKVIRKSRGYVEV